MRLRTRPRLPAWRARPGLAGLWLAALALAGVLCMPCMPAFAVLGAGVQPGAFGVSVGADAQAEGSARGSAPEGAAHPAAAPCQMHAAGAPAGGVPTDAPLGAGALPGTSAALGTSGPADAPAAPCCAGAGCAWMAAGVPCGPDVGVPAPACALPPLTARAALIVPHHAPTPVQVLSRAPPPPPRPDVLLI